jgi:hypothetical protein
MALAFDPDNTGFIVNTMHPDKIYEIALQGLKSCPTTARHETFLILTFYAFSHIAHV